MRPALQDEASQFRELARHFFSRFFDNDLVAVNAGDVDMRATVVNILAMLAAPGMLLPFLFMTKYSNMQRMPLYVRDLASLGEKEFFICFSMTVMGLVTVIEWEMLFPDRRDYANLTPLPIRLRTMFAAKIGALLAFLAIFSAVINAFSPIMFPAVVLQSDSLLMLPGFARCHIISILAANAFVFFLCVAVQGILMNVLGYRAFRRISPYVQFGLVALLILMFLLSSRISSELRLGAAINSRAVYLFPPLWFLGLYQAQLGWTSPVFRELAATARMAAGWTTVVALATYILSYRRHVTRSLESADEFSTIPSAMEKWISRVLDRLVIRDGLQQAAFYFIWKTLTRSRRHKLLFAAYVAVGCALIFEGLAVLVARGGSSWMYRPIPELLPAPLILAFFILCGMRHVFAVPSELRANWLFQVSDRGEAKRCLAGVRKAMLALGVAPLFAVLLPLHVMFWGWRTAVLHMLFGTVIAWLLVDVLLANFEKFPFTCSYLPGKANLKVSWPLYLFGFTTYVSAVLALEYWMLQRPVRFVCLAGVVVLVRGALLIYRWRVGHDVALVFDEQPEPLVRTLNLWA
ncbi:MAG TPA: hypothetical protein VMR62_13455 [Bryobacteraceae bacterium]|jgi:hypothetical protein|nr:hypothetical protein [Bryobacteraceae bacterium]